MDNQAVKNHRWRLLRGCCGASGAQSGNSCSIRARNCLDFSGAAFENIDDAIVHRQAFRRGQAIHDNLRFPAGR